MFGFILLNAFCTMHWSLGIFKILENQMSETFFCHALLVLFHYNSFHLIHFASRCLRNFFLFPPVDWCLGALLLGVLWVGGGPEGFTAD